MDRLPDDYWPHVHAHIDALLDRPIEEHEAYLDAHCPDQAMRRDVKSWLAYIYTSTDVLDESVATYARALLNDGPPPARPPLWRADNSDSRSASASSSDAPKPTASQPQAQPEPSSSGSAGRTPTPKADERSLSRFRAAWPLWAGAAFLSVFILWWSFSS